MSVEVKEYFDVKYGVNLELVNLAQSNKGINFVSRTSQNNGVSARVKLIKNKNQIQPTQFLFLVVVLLWKVFYKKKSIIVGEIFMF